MSDQHENPMILEGQMHQARLDRIPQEEEREVRPERCGECNWMTADYSVRTSEHWHYCGHRKWRGGDRALPPSLKGKPPDWCPWEEE